MCKKIMKIDIEQLDFRHGYIQLIYSILWNSLKEIDGENNILEGSFNPKAPG